MKKIKEQHQDETNIEATVEAFHRIFYGMEVTWMGYPIQKMPTDLFIYQDILWECRPDLIVECGTAHSGSALYLANLFDLMHHGMVLTIDIKPWVGYAQHPRIIYLTGDSVAPATIKKVREIAGGFRKVMVILDSDHTKDHVLKEMDAYSEIVTPQQYMIVEDGDIHGHPVREELPEGPFEAIAKWLPKHDEFYMDKMCERFLLTQNPNGYLRKVR